MKGDTNMFCTSCGKKLEENTKFCTSCGTPTNFQQQNAEVPDQRRIVNQEVPQEQVSQEQVLQEQVPQEQVSQRQVLQEQVPQEQISQKRIPQEQNSFVPKKKKKGKTFVVAAISIIVILGGSVAGYFLYQNHIMKQADSVIAFNDEGEYDKASKLYEKYSGKKEAFDDKVSEKLIERAKQLREDYFSEVIAYDTAVEQLHNFDKFDIDELNDTTEEIAQWMDKINISRESYKQGESYFDQGDYAGAYEKFGRVIEEDTKFYILAVKEMERAQFEMDQEEAWKLEEARRQEEERINDLRDQALTDAEYYAYSADYESAIMVIEQALVEIPEDMDLMYQRAVYQVALEMSSRVSSITTSNYDYSYQDDLDNNSMTVSIEIPVLEGDAVGYEEINRFFEFVKQAYIESNDLLAENDKLYSHEEYSIPYSFDVTYSVQYNNNGILCIVMDGNTYTGGAHGYPLRETYTFNLKNGASLGLRDLIATDEDGLRPFIMEEFERLYSQSPELYWEDAMATVENSTLDFDYMRYYLMEDAICIFYFPYELASYADGFIEIVIPYAGNEPMFSFLQP